MKVLVIGSGGREHALVWALKRSGAFPSVYCAPGNAGIAGLARCVPVKVSERAKLIQFARDEGIDVTIVGPEGPLAEGLVDEFIANDLNIFGPNQAAARLESSKVFAKAFMTRHQVPTARYQIADTPGQALELLRRGEFGSGDEGLVIKADGLAAGKGVIVASSRNEAEQAIEDLMVTNVLGAKAAERIVIEEVLNGREASVLVFTDGHDFILMPPARDHKRIGENETGPNTGGMGSITDASVIEPDVLERVVREIIEPTLAGARAEGFPVKGVLFFGLMLTNSGPSVLEYNIRFGDPETQAILMRLKTDLLSVVEATINQTLGSTRVEWHDGSSACVILANRGYPGKHETGAVIKGLDLLESESGVTVFHSGTSRSEDGDLLATGGRVLGVTAGGNTLEIALKDCYKAIEKIHWAGMQYRRDIGRFQANWRAGSSGPD